jgi:transposase
MVWRRGAHRPEEQDHATLGAAWNAAFGAARPANRLHLHLRCDLPEGRKGAALVLPACNTGAMNLHLAEIATEVAPRKHAILLLDQAGWHLSSRLIVPPNITILPLPAKCPELNPQENVWQFMRDNWLSNRVFKSYEDIVNHCCCAWNRLIDQPWRIMFIGMRDWAYRF